MTEEITPKAVKDETVTDNKMNRREFVKKVGIAGAAIAASNAITGFPMVWAQKSKDITLRQFGTGVSNINAIAVKAKEDLGINLQMTAMDTDSVAQRAITQPKSYDIADIEYFICKKVFPSGVLQPMDTNKLKNYKYINSLFKNGKINPESTIAQGTAPHTVGYVEGPKSTKFSSVETQWMTLVPTIYNADTLGIRPDLIDRPITKWADIMDPAFKGKASILNIPSIGIMDAAMICESMGEIQYGNKGNMTKDEINKTIEILKQAKRDGQFRAFWKSFDESVNLMASGEVVIQSMWSPAVAAVREKGIPCVYQPLEEGYRAWGGGIGIAKHLSGMELDMAYEYIDWYLSGWVGAYLNRQGYYSAAPETSKKYMSDDEVGFWLDGKAAQGDILSPEGKVMEKPGTIRDGGSFETRMGSVSCWNSVMDENKHMMRKWNEFIAS